MDNLLAYILMALMMSMLPGTDTVLIMKNTLNHGAKAGRYTILGMATGLTFWTVIAVLGLSVVIAQSVFLFNAIKYMGAAYLFYLGVRAFFTKNTLSLEAVQAERQRSIDKSSRHHYKESYLQGAISNILNPKTVLVYITFMPQFIDLNGNTNQQLIGLGLILTIIAVGWFLILVYFLDHMKKWLKKPKFQKVFQKSTGVMLIGFGVKTVI
ncbi:homoserine/threonine efflux transporter [Neobacillus ginsengisoli]|uniref:RhtB (Resistance to homoserine/threonine) family protein n=1 Tax=Neobacillus ginsengisoli TaxID=904295 RepID=A0ABT9XYS5_9BACI|nr:homoserine/threonine efflux transporter [Neobacillus ginsengisoli]MDQ0200722.1 RhtB (resistance to homoserine/threonine) family protein [Neobacillus ginsengisoli]